MKTLFRPCIDLHNGQVKQIVGSSLKDDESSLKTNFVSDLPPSHYAEMYKGDNLFGGHVIMLGKGNEEAAIEALSHFKNGLQIGGGINIENAQKFIDAGASHIIVTSWLFNEEGEFLQDHLENLSSTIGIDRLVIDLSCKKTGDQEWTVAMNRWQTLTNIELCKENIRHLEQYCDEFLIHAADVEGKCQGIDHELVQKLAEWVTIPVTYAGGVRNIADLELVQKSSGGKVDVAVGSALDIFGGKGITYKECLEFNLRK
jgi:phosphoribosylformimino-5-aminoimidazole carboxamide ribotide isomerase